MAFQFMEQQMVGISLPSTLITQITVSYKIIKSLAMKNKAAAEMAMELNCIIQITLSLQITQFQIMIMASILKAT
jgi:hypothetical protein